VARTYITILGNIELNRQYYYDKKNKYGFFPVEEEHPILKDTCFPEVKEMICYTSILEPYASSQEILKKLSNLNISVAEIQKITKQIGGKLVEIEDNQIKDPVKYNPSKKKIEKMVVSMDGAMTNTKEGWKEVKSGVIFEFKNNTDKDGNILVDHYNKSYISRIEDSNSFGKRLKEEARRRHYLDVNELVVIGDGAPWIWDLADIDYPFSTQIVDWYHAKQHLFNLTKLIYGEVNNDESSEFINNLSDILYTGNVEKMNDEIHNKIMKLNISDNLEKLKKIQTEIEYFKKNKTRMRYQVFRKKGYPIGSGVMEATCKQLVQIRLKRNGMKWTINGAHCILQLRCYYLSNRWNEVVNFITPKSA
jgi:hypothetical protein